MHVYYRHTVMYNLNNVYINKDRVNISKKSNLGCNAAKFGSQCSKGNTEEYVLGVGGKLKTAICPSPVDSNPTTRSLKKNTSR